MKFYSTKEIAERWGVSQRRVIRLAGEGRLAGAVQFGNSWMIPETAEKPADGRTKAVRENPGREEVFRYPSFLDLDADAFVPPLSQEERLLQQAQRDFYACRFEESALTARGLAKNAKNRNIQLAALHLCSFLAFLTKEHDLQDTSNLRMKLMLAEDFPHKNEMQLLRFEYDATFGFQRSIIEDFYLDPAYDYHPSVCNAMIYLSMCSILNGDITAISKVRGDVFEICCRQMERDGCLFDAQRIHFGLFLGYLVKQDKERMLYHARRGLEIARDRQYYFMPCYFYTCYPEPMEEILDEMPTETAQTIREMSVYIDKNYLSYQEERKDSNVYCKLDNSDYRYILLAHQGYTNRRIAQDMNISYSAVIRKFSEIYKKMGVSGKRELIQTFTDALME